MKNKSVSSNVVFNVLYRVLMYVFPLLIASYTSRVLLADGVGRVSFVQNIVSYFTSIVALGIPTYGIREIAKCKSMEERTSVFSSLFFINFISTIVCSIVYYLIVLNVPYFRNNKLLYIVGGLQIVFNFINIDWLYQGLEEYRYIATRSLIVRSISVLFIFIFVKSIDDGWKYLLITCIVYFGNYFFNIFHARKVVKLKFYKNAYKKHLKSVFVLLATVLAVEMYTKIDTTFIGVLLEESDVGNYSNANKLIQIVVTFLAAINAVILPRLSANYKEGKKVEFGTLLNNFYYVILLISIPSCVGIFMTAPDLIVLLFGSSFTGASILLRILSPLIVIMAIGNLVGTQAIISIGEEKRKLYATLVAGGINLLFTPILIKIIGTTGACVASVVSESIVLLIYIFILKRYITLYIRLKRIIVIISATIFMTIVILLIKQYCYSIVVRFLLSVVLGSIIYFSIVMIADRSVRDYAKGFLRKIITSILAKS